MGKQYEPTIGLEIHAELKTKSKMFCSCANDPDEKHPNVNVCPICMGHPGTLPVINGEAVKKVLKTGLALNCAIPGTSKFDRKNYFYPDLPKGYQISQYDMPLCGEGYLEIFNLKRRKIRIRRIHLEEDTGRLIHAADGDYSLVDFNRAGISLMELVTEPDINSAREAREFAEELRLILRYLDVSDADMEKGQLRVEANISLRRENPNDQKLGTKVEVKNLNSFRAVEKAINYEIQRQAELLDKGEKITQETRGWDEDRGITFSQREKEEAHDYRYFPEPDLPIIKIKNTPKESLRDPTGQASQNLKIGDDNAIDIDEIKRDIPELPKQKRERFGEQLQLLPQEIEIFIQDEELSNYFEKVVSELQEWIKAEHLDKEEIHEIVKLAANYIITDLASHLKKSSMSVGELLINPENFAELIILIYKGEISSKIAKIVLEEMFGSGADPHHIVKERGLGQVSDEGELDDVVSRIIELNSGPVGDYKKGKAQSLQYLIGQIMKETKGVANPEIITKLLKEKLA